MAACCTHPLDLIKIRMQTFPGPIKPSVCFIIRTSINATGFPSLYTGLTASLMRQMSYSLVRLGTYEEIKVRMSQNGPPSTFSLIMAAIFSGCLGGIVGNPADILLVRMTSDFIRPRGRRYNYPDAFRGLFSLVKQEGLLGLGRGIGPNTARAMLMNASQVGSYDYFKSTLLRSPLLATEKQSSDNLYLHVLASLLSGTFATTVCSPADVLRSRIMAGATNESVSQIVKRSVREEGFLFLFKGWTPAFIRLGPNTVLLFVFFEQLKTGWSNLIS